MKQGNLKSLFIFRRDLRLEDNAGLIEALKSSEKVVPCFIFDPRQIESTEYKSENALQFMIESLKDLENQLENKGGKLYLFYGKAEDVVKQLIKNEGIDAIFVNRDYTPFSIQRDSKIKQVCENKNIGFYKYPDSLLNEPEDVLKDDGKPYTIFTAFFRKASKIPVRKSQKNRYDNFYKKPINLERHEIYPKILKEENERIYVRGGRSECLKKLGNLKRFKDYGKERDYPAKQMTTGLSAHNKFGTCSIREVYHAIRDSLGPTHPLIRQLYWRDFFTHVCYHFPHVFGKSFHRKFDEIKWSYDREKFSAWCEGRTGFPIVDAGMRELNTTGFMHNRARLIVSSFLTKDLHIDWRWGEKYFATKLVDYDPAVNNGNWQWSASTGCDAQPWFRIFNPWLQQRRYDPECTYVKKWVPELRELSAKEIHNPERLAKGVTGYLEPILVHSEEARKTKAIYGRVIDIRGDVA